MDLNLAHDLFHVSPSVGKQLNKAELLCEDKINHSRGGSCFFLQFDLVNMMQVFKDSIPLLLLLLFYSGSVVCCKAVEEKLSDQLSLIK